MALTIAGAAVDEWVSVAQNTVNVGTDIDVSDSYASSIHIGLALGAAVAHTGTQVIVQVASNADDEFWMEYASFIALVGTGAIEALAAEASAAATQLEVASLTGFTIATGGALLAFLEDTTAGAGELVRIVSTSVEGGNDLINLADGLERTHAATTSVLHNKAATYVIPLPFGTVRARVIVDNTYDADGDVIWRKTHVVKTTALT